MENNNNNNNNNSDFQISRRHATSFLSSLLSSLVEQKAETSSSPLSAPFGLYPSNFCPRPSLSLSLSHIHPSKIERSRKASHQNLYLAPKQFRSTIFDLLFITPHVEEETAVFDLKAKSSLY